MPDRTQGGESPQDQQASDGHDQQTGPSPPSRRNTPDGTDDRVKIAGSTRGSSTFLNLDEPYPNQVFAIVIWGLTGVPLLPLLRCFRRLVLLGACRRRAAR